MFSIWCFSGYKRNISLITNQFLMDFMTTQASMRYNS